MTDDELRNLKAAKDEALLAVSAIDSAIDHLGGLTDDERASAVVLLRDEAEQHLRKALSKVSLTRGG
jgi:hypothetical protein